MKEGSSSPINSNHEILLKMHTYNSESIPTDVLYPNLKLSKHYTSINQEEPLELFSPRSALHNNNNDTANFSFNIFSNKGTLSYLNKMKNAAFDFGNFQHVKV